MIASLINGHKRAMSATYLAFPCHEILTAEYKYYTISTSSSDNNEESALHLISCSNGSTTIEVFPVPGQSFPFRQRITLTKHQTKFISIGGGADITGTRIVSDKPIIVVSGHEGGSIPSNGTLEPMAQQVPPTHLWGQNFMIIPFKGHVPGQIIMVVSSANDTSVSYNCHKFKHQTILSAGGSHRFFVPPDVYCYIEANASVLVGQFPFSPSENKHTDTTMVKF